MHHLSHRSTPSLKAMALAVLAMFAVVVAQRPAEAAGEYTIQEVVDAGHGFFGETSGALAKVIEQAFEQYGLPTATFSVRKAPAPLSPASPMAKACSTPRMSASMTSSGRARRSASTTAETARGR